MSLTRDKYVKALIVRILQQAEEERVSLNIANINKVIDELHTSTSFPPLDFKTKPDGVYSPEVSRAFYLLNRTNTLECRETCRLTELGKLASEALIVPLKDNLLMYNLSMDNFDEAIRGELREIERGENALTPPQL